MKNNAAKADTSMIVTRLQQVLHESTIDRMGNELRINESAFMIKATLMLTKHEHSVWDDGFAKGKKDGQ